MLNEIIEMLENFSDEEIALLLERAREIVAER